MYVYGSVDLLFLQVLICDGVVGWDKCHQCTVYLAIYYTNTNTLCSLPVA